MNALARRRLEKGCAMALLLLAGCAAAAPVNESVSRVSVAFIEPEKFTDARRAELQPTSSEILRELEKFLIETGARYVPADMRLSIRVTNIDLAGEFEPVRGPQFDHVRVNKSIYPPRIALEFRIADTAEQTVKEGKRDLTDIDYLLRVAHSREDYLRYEKALLRDWLRAEFSDLRAAP
jgi:Protein of unknown function (DUF3016)